MGKDREEFQAEESWLSDALMKWIELQLQEWKWETQQWQLEPQWAQLWSLKTYPSLCRSRVAGFLNPEAYHNDIMY